MVPVERTEKVPEKGLSGVNTFVLNVKVLLALMGEKENI